MKLATLYLTLGLIIITTTIIIILSDENNFNTQDFVSIETIQIQSLMR